MRGYMTISDEDKNSILQQHSTFYNGYAAGNVPSGPQPLSIDKGPNDTQGINVNNRGEVSTYKNHLVNESKEEEVKEYAADDMDVSEIDPSFDFQSGGPEQFDDENDDMRDFETELEFDDESASDELDSPPSFGDEEEDYSYSDESYGMDIDSIMSMFDGSVTTDLDDEFDGREEYEGEVSAYEFDSEGAMDTDLYEEEQCEGCGSEMCEQCGGEMREGECMECGTMYEEMDSDLKESFFKEKRRISEMFDRFKKFN